MGAQATGTRRPSTRVEGSAVRPSSARLRRHRQLADAPGVLLGQAPGLGVGVALGPDVGDRLLGVGQGQRPAVVVEDLHAVDQLDLAVLAQLDQRAHDGALLLPRASPPSRGRCGRAGRPLDHLRQRRAVRGQQLEQLHQGGGGVEGGQEAGEDEAAVGAGGEARRPARRPRP